MTAVPLPFVLAFVLVLLALQLERAQPRIMAPGPLRWLLAACIAQAVLVGLRWSLDTRAVLGAMTVMSATLPPLTWLTLREAPVTARDWPHALPPLAVAALTLSQHWLIDVALLAIAVFYISLLAAVLRRGANALGDTPFGAIGMKRTAVTVALVLLSLLAVVDAGIALDFAFNGGAAAAHVVAATNALTIAAIGVVLVRLASPARTAPPNASAAARTPAGSQATAPGTERPPGVAVKASPQDARPSLSADVAEDGRIVAEVNALLESEDLFRDPALDLKGLARRARRTPREISTAINRVHGRNVSRYVNDHRVAAACIALEQTAEPVSNIMQDVGFQTKSNFNREFRRVTGMSPVQWRTTAGGAPSGQA